MNFKTKRKLIQEAQYYLISNPQDLLHDITHHYRTWLLAQQIGPTVNQDFNWDLLEIICWWHDVSVPDIIIPKGERIVNVTAKYLKEKIAKQYKEIIFDSINSHEYGSIPSYPEGKILQDADKLELLSKERVRLGIEAVKAGLFPKEKALQTYKTLTEKWIPNLANTLHFAKSRQLYKELKKESAEIYKEFRNIVSG